MSKQRATVPADSQALILASSSPYRRELLARLQLPFVCESPDIDESAHAAEAPEALVRRLSREKAEAVAAKHPERLVIGSDQVAINGMQILGKPGSREAAVSQLKAASGREVTFLTGLCVIDGQQSLVLIDHVATVVGFRNLSELDIRNYLAAEPAFDCAGSFKAEGLGISLFDSVNSADPTALVGLPLIRLSQMLRETGRMIPPRLPAQA